jgi:hypothetical protein
MAKTKKTTRKPKRGASTDFIVVRGKGNTVFLAIARPVVRNSALSKMLDGYRASGRGVTRLSRAFHIKGKRALVNMLGGNFGDMHHFGSKEK